MQGEPGQVLNPVRCAVIGHPVHHSLSPALHRAAYHALGLEWEYSACDVEPGDLDRFMAGLDDRWRGLSVTMPHKEAIIAHGQPDELVRLAGAANTWVRTADGPIVRNTDVPGFALACAAHGLTTVSAVTVIGNGATARSSLIAVARMGATRVNVVVRERARASGLVTLGSDLGVPVTILERGTPLPEADLAISTVPVAGSADLADELAATSPVLFDSVYDPWPTPVALAGQRAGRMVLNGLDLLAGQAVDQIRWMTGELVGFELLRSTAQREIDTRG